MGAGTRLAYARTIFGQLEPVDAKFIEFDHQAGDLVMARETDATWLELWVELDGNWTSLPI
ncbi:MAG: hypothetical protein AAGA56_06460 [Myxococcota bacterium]